MQPLPHLFVGSQQGMSKIMIMRLQLTNMSQLQWAPSAQTADMWPQGYRDGQDSENRP